MAALVVGGNVRSFIISCILASHLLRVLFPPMFLLPSEITHLSCVGWNTALNTPTRNGSTDSETTLSSRAGAVDAAPVGASAQSAPTITDGRASGASALAPTGAEAPLLASTLTDAVTSPTNPVAPVLDGSHDAGVDVKGLAAVGFTCEKKLLTDACFKPGAVRII